MTVKGTETMVKAILWDVDGTLLDFAAADMAIDYEIQDLHQVFEVI